MNIEPWNGTHFVGIKKEYINKNKNKKQKNNCPKAKKK